VLELILYKWKTLKYMFTDGNVETFIDEKSEQHESVRNWSKQTRYKIKQVTLKTLVEAELLVKNGKEYTITSIPISKQLHQYVEQQKNHEFLLFTLND
ncbi:BrxA family protein, partial [Peribacillus sp. NPDC060186]